MAIIPLSQAAGFASAAGFSGNGLKTILAIMMAESSGNATISHQNGDGSIDRGVLQINTKYHPEVSDACAFSPACAFKEGYRISLRGTNFREWSTYTGGEYLKYMNQNITLVQSPASGGTPWFDYSVTQPYGLPYESGFGGHHGIDLATPPETPISALLPMTISAIDTTNNWGVSVNGKLDTPYNGATYFAVIHLDAANPALRVGMHVDPGALLGWSGGENNIAQLNGATNPTGTHFVDSPTMSSGPHTHVSLTLGPEYGVGTGWDDPSKYPNLNPQSLLSAAKAGTLAGVDGSFASIVANGQSTNSGLPTTATNTSTTLSGFAFAPIDISTINNAYLQAAQVSHQVLQSTPGFLGMCSALDDAEQFPGIYNAFSGDVNPLDAPQNAVMSVLGTIGGNFEPFVIRTLLLVVGAVLVMGLMLKLAEPVLGPAMQAAAVLA